MIISDLTGTADSTGSEIFGSKKSLKMTENFNKNLWKFLAHVIWTKWYNSVNIWARTKLFTSKLD